MERPQTGQASVASLVSVTAGTIALVTGILAISSIFFASSRVTIRGIDPAIEAREQAEKANSRAEESLGAANQAQAGLESLLKSLKEIPLHDEAIALRLDGAERSILEAKTSLANIEKVILQDPSRAIDMVLVRKEMESLKDHDQQGIVALQHDVERLYDLGKWIFGLMFTMSLGVLSLAIGPFFKKEEKK